VYIHRRGSDQKTDLTIQSEFSLHFLEKGMDFQEFAEKLWETMNSVGRLRVVLEAKDEEIHRERDRTSFQVV
jgi:hypothetical protein